MRILYKVLHEGKRSRLQRFVMSLAEGPRITQELFIARSMKSLLARGEAKESHGVIVIPGFLGRDRFNQPLFDFLNSVGYKTSGWMNGRNLGPTAAVLTRLTRELDFKIAQTGQKVTLIGHSLGGIYARELARQMPDKVEQVITLGSPFGKGQSRGTASSKLYWNLNENVAAAKRTEPLDIAPPVPVTSVFTRSDCVIEWRTALQHDGHQRCENIEVYGSHCGLTLNASVWYLLLDRLAQNADDWRPFDNTRWRRAVYPFTESSVTQASLQH